MYIKMIFHEPETGKENQHILEAAEIQLFFPEENENVDPEHRRIGVNIASHLESNYHNYELLPVNLSLYLMNKDGKTIDRHQWDYKGTKLR